MASEEIRKYKKLLIKYFREKFPEKLKYQPKVIEVNRDNVVFGMTKHMGSLVLSKDILKSKSSVN